LNGKISVNNRGGIPQWARRDILAANDVRPVKKLLRDKKLSTVCEEARCPNIAECFGKKRATFIILGDICTRNCAFCSIRPGSPFPPDPKEPENIAEACLELGLEYAVLTSVTRDDLPDGGAGHFVKVISEISKTNKNTGIEVLTPDFGGNEESIDLICMAGPHIYNHNIETVPSRYVRVRPEADYGQSINLLRYVKKNFPDIITKSGIMLGFGETKDEIISVMNDLLKAGCDLLTIGQYMRPTKRHINVSEYISPEVFDNLADTGKKMGFKGVYSGPLVRSSFNAEYFKNGVDIGRVLQN